MKKLLSILPIILLSQCHPDRPAGIELDNAPGKVEIFGANEISTRLYERDIAISPDRKEIIFTLADYKQSVRCLVGMVKKGKEWGKREILTFSGRYSDIEPFFSMDGKKLYFASNRPVNGDTTKNDFNIWIVERSNTGWSKPRPLELLINTEKDEFFPSLDLNNNLYFTSVRENGIGSEDIFLSRFVDGTYTKPEALDTNINTSTYEFNACIHPDGSLLIFSSYGRKDDLGGGDLYYSKKDVNGKWMPAKNMGPEINSEKLDYCPFIDIKGNNFYFTSEKMYSPGKQIENAAELEEFANGMLNGMGNIYRIRLSKAVNSDQ